MTVKEIMTRNVITVSPEASLKDVGSLLKEKRISGIPVVDVDNEIVGIITVDDILKILEEIYQWQELERRATGVSPSELVGKERLNTKVKNMMSKNVCTLDENKTIMDVMNLVFTKKIHTIPITKDNKLVGVIGKRDLVYSCF